MKILVTDDDPSSRRFVVEALKMTGAEVFEAETGQQAVAAAKEKKPDLILIDHVMPEMNGFDAIKIIRHEPGLEAVPFVMITGNYEVQTLQEQEKFSNCAFLPKPYTVDQLMSTIEVALDRPFP
ncbi:MAG: response regulator [Elusimicrobia bacterium]|nr:response regulator [Elusimicrobiota bacterium]